jgi:hypothetical protein
MEIYLNRNKKTLSEKYETIHKQYISDLYSSSEYQENKIEEATIGRIFVLNREVKECVYNFRG